MKAIVITALVFGLQLFAQDGIKQPVQATTTDRVNFAPGGVIRLTTASSNLFVEAWDRPEVEITTIKSSWRARCLDDVRVVTDRRSDTELAITTTVPSEQLLRASVRPHVRRDDRAARQCAAGFAAGDPPRRRLPDGEPDQRRYRGVQPQRRHRADASGSWSIRDRREKQVRKCFVRFCRHRPQREADRANSSPVLIRRRHAGSTCASVSEASRSRKCRRRP